MARTDADLMVAHAAMRFIETKGLLDEFYTSGALTGGLCNLTCRHESDMLKINHECECGDYHSNDDDHHWESNQQCPRTPTASYGGIWLCDICATAEPE